MSRLIYRGYECVVFHPLCNWNNHWFFYMRTSKIHCYSIWNILTSKTGQRNLGQDRSATQLGEQRLGWPRRAVACEWQPGAGSSSPMPTSIPKGLYGIRGLVRQEASVWKRHLTWQGPSFPTTASLRSRAGAGSGATISNHVRLVSASTHHLKITHWKQKGEKLAHRVDDVIEACNPRPGPRGPPDQAFHDNNTCFQCMNLSGFAVHWVVFGFRRKPSQNL